MESFEDRLSKRKEEIAKIEQARKKQEAKKASQKLEEVERLRGILERFNIKEKLIGIQEEIWEKGAIKELATYEERVRGNDFSLQLFTGFLDVHPRTEFHNEGSGLFGRTQRETVYRPGVSQVCITVGAISVNYLNHSDWRGPDRTTTGDYIHFSILKDERLKMEKDIEDSFFFRAQHIIHASAGDSKISMFTAEKLMEFTKSDLLPSNLAAEGERKIQEYMRRGYLRS